MEKLEDVALCIAVVTIGEDGDKAIGQEKKKLWECIHEVYVERNGWFLKKNYLVWNKFNN